MSEGGVTGGGDSGTSGLSPRMRLLLLPGLPLAYGLLRAAINIATVMEDTRRMGHPLPFGYAALYELSSLVGWMAMFVVIWIAVERLRPPRVSLPVAILAHAALTLPVSLGHVAIMVAIRGVVFAAIGEDYDFGDRTTTLLYEYRKDAATYILLALLIVLINWVSRRYGQQSPVTTAATQDLMLEVPSGSRTLRIPVEEIGRVEAAGNYVELDWNGRTILHRATLAAIEQKLAPAGFARIHRSRLVRRNAVRRIETLQSGDFNVELKDGATLRGSRRYRAGLESGEEQ